MKMFLQVDFDSQNFCFTIIIYKSVLLISKNLVLNVYNYNYCAYMHNMCTNNSVCHIPPYLPIIRLSPMEKVTVDFFFVHVLIYEERETIII